MSSCAAKRRAEGPTEMVMMAELRLLWNVSISKPREMRVEKTYGDVGVELAWLFVGDVCTCAASLLDWLESFSLNDLSFFLLVCLPARYPKLSLYDLFVLLVVNISTVPVVVLQNVSGWGVSRTQREAAEGCETRCGESESYVLCPATARLPLLRQHSRKVMIRSTVMHRL